LYTFFTASICATYPVHFMTSQLLIKNAGVTFRSEKIKNIRYVRFSVVMMLLHTIHWWQACCHK
jgi:hypothetical protein